MCYRAATVVMFSPDAGQPGCRQMRYTAAEPVLYSKSATGRGQCFSLKNSSLNALLPFYNIPKNVLFIRLGMRDYDGASLPEAAWPLIMDGYRDTTCFMAWTGATSTAATAYAYFHGRRSPNNLSVSG